MRKRTRKNGKLVVSANSNEKDKVKFYDKKGGRFKSSNLSLTNQKVVLILFVL
jgi:hypothetical protein